MARVIIAGCENGGRPAAPRNAACAVRPLDGACHLRHAYPACAAVFLDSNHLPDSSEFGRRGLGVGRGPPFSCCADTVHDAARLAHAGQPARWPIFAWSQAAFAAATGTSAGALPDPLNGLPNRVLFEDRMAHAVRAATATLPAAQVGRVARTKSPCVHRLRRVAGHYSFGMLRRSIAEGAAIAGPPRAPSIRWRGGW